MSLKIQAAQPYNRNTTRSQTKKIKSVSHKVAKEKRCFQEGVKGQRERTSGLDLFSDFEGKRFHITSELFY